MFNINSIKFHNFRNIFDSAINLNDERYKNNFGSVILGIYGQNGTSKSSVGYSLALLQHICFKMSGAFCHRFNYDFGIYDSNMKLTYDFSFIDEYIPNSTYIGAIISYEFRKDQNKHIYISKESLTLKTRMGRPFSIDVDRSASSLFFNINDKDLNKIKDLFSCNDKVAISILSQSNKEQTSVFLSRFMLNQINDVLTRENRVRDEKLSYIMDFVSSLLRNMHIVMPDSYGVSITNNLLVCYGEKEDPMLLLAPNIDGSIAITESQKQRIELIVNKSNAFVKKIIPDFNVKLDAEQYNKGLSEAPRYKARLLSVKKEGSFNFENESEGVKRIFFIASCIARSMVEKDYILFIDELDEGIFEVLLGNLISTIYEHCKGQFIFTCHNLYPLELLSHWNFIFSTVNPNNRFVRLIGAKPNNNFRDYYIRKIMYGDADSSLSNPSDDVDILEGLLNAANITRI